MLDRVRVAKPTKTKHRVSKARRVLKQAWHSQRHTAIKRGVPFLLTYEQWLDIWLVSGHLHERGRCKGQYVMARFGDTGPYDVNNVRIVTVKTNHHEYHKGRPLSAAHRNKLSTIHKGRKFSDDSRKKMSMAHTGKILSATHKANIGNSTRGVLSVHAKFTTDEIIKIRKQYVRGKTTLKQIARQYGVCIQTIGNVISNNTYINVGV